MRGVADYMVVRRLPKVINRDSRFVSEYVENGIRFLYPDDWQLDHGESDDSLTITVSSPETSFWCLSLFRETPSAADVLTAAIAAFEEEYDEVDVHAGEDEQLLFGTESTNHIVEFVCLELVNTVALQAVELDEFTALVLYQGTDHELKNTRPILEGITASLQVQ